MSEEYQSKFGDACDAIASEIHQHQVRVDGDERFQEAMLAAGYEPCIHTAPCTDDPRTVAPAVTLQQHSYMDV